MLSNHTVHRKILPKYGKNIRHFFAIYNRRFCNTSRKLLEKKSLKSTKRVVQLLSSAAIIT